MVPTIQKPRTQIMWMKRICGSVRHNMKYSAATIAITTQGMASSRFAIRRSPRESNCSIKMGRKSDNLLIFISFNMRVGELQLHTQNRQIEIVSAEQHSHQRGLIGQLANHQRIAIVIFSVDQLWEPCSLFEVQFAAQADLVESRALVSVHVSILFKRAESFISQWRYLWIQVLPAEIPPSGDGKGNHIAYIWRQGEKTMKNITFALVVFVFVLSACGVTPPLVTGSGKMVTQIFDVQDFDQIRLSTSGVLYIEQGDEFNLTIETDDNILPLLSVEVEQGVLTIRTEPATTILQRETLIYRVTLPELSALDLSGSAEICVENFEAQSLNVNVRGSGDVIFMDLDTQLFLVPHQRLGQCHSGKSHSRNRLQRIEQLGRSAPDRHSRLA